MSKSSGQRARQIEEEQRLRRVLQMNPGDPRAMLNLAGCLSKQKAYPKLREAKQLASEVIQKIPDFAFAYIRLSQSELGLREFDLAESHARQALQIDPQIPFGNFMIAESKLARLRNVKGRAEKRAVYAEALSYYAREKDINSAFRVDHQRVASLLRRGGLSREATYQSDLAVKSGNYSVGTMLLPFLRSAGPIWVATLILLMGFFRDLSKSFVLAIPIAIGIVLLLRLVKNRQLRTQILSSILVLEILFVVIAGVSWDSYRKNLNPFTPIPFVKIDWSKVDTSTSTPTGVVNRAIKSDINNDYAQLWGLFSKRLKASYVSLDLYKSRSAQSSPVEIQVVQAPVKGLINSRVFSENYNKAKVHYRVYYSQAQLHSGDELTDDIDLVKERGTWKIDSPSFPIMASKESRNLPQPLFGFSAIPENYSSPRAAILTWVKFVHSGDLRGIWRTYSQRLKADRWNNDFNFFQSQYSQTLDKKAGHHYIDNFSVVDEHRVVQGSSAYKFTTDCIANAVRQNFKWSGEIFLTKEGNLWKVDATPYFVVSS